MISTYSTVVTATLLHVVSLIINIIHNGSITDTYTDYTIALVTVLVGNCGLKAKVDVAVKNQNVVHPLY